MDLLREPATEDAILTAVFEALNPPHCNNNNNNNTTPNNPGFTFSNWRDNPSLDTSPLIASAPVIASSPVLVTLFDNSDNSALMHELFEQTLSVHSAPASPGVVGLTLQPWTASIPSTTPAQTHIFPESESTATFEIPTSNSADTKDILSNHASISTETPPDSPELNSDAQKSPTSSLSHKQKKPRFKASKADLDTLCGSFAESPFPTRAERRRLAEVLNLEAQQIKIWFQNARARERAGGKVITKPEAKPKETL
ncbi:hypothetical protein HDU80_008879 [Chytriomyces hyalinus]|nr:hypothetical protein HDU80_008879 [Chytriomyces hyalinus]